MPSKYNVRDTSNFTTWPLQTEIEILFNGEARIGYVWLDAAMIVVDLYKNESDVF